MNFCFIIRFSKTNFCIFCVAGEPGSDQIQRLALSHSDLESVPTFVQHQRGLRGLALDGNSALIKVGGGAALKEALTGLNHLQVRIS
jgi:hypothetical protein